MKYNQISFIEILHGDASRIFYEILWTLTTQVVVITLGI